MPLGHSEIQTAQPQQDQAQNTVRIYGTSDLIEVEGSVSGCDEYNFEDAHFMVIGAVSQVRVRVWYTDNGVWAISASQAAEGMKILPVRIEGGAGTYSPTAVIEGVRLVIHERGGKA